MSLFERKEEASLILVANAYNLHIQGAKPRGLQVLGQSGLHRKTLSQTKQNNPDEMMMVQKVKASTRNNPQKNQVREAELC